MSHADLEDFLCDLGEEVESQPRIVIDVAECGNEFLASAVHESISDEQRVRDFCRVSFIPSYFSDMIVDCASVFHKTTHAPLMVALFCFIRCQ